MKQITEEQGITTKEVFLTTIFLLFIVVVLPIFQIGWMTVIGSALCK